jgi:hypothetical protein
MTDSFLGSALYIRLKQPAPQQNCVYLLNFREINPEALNKGTKLQPSVGAEKSNPKEPKRCFNIFLLGKSSDTLESSYCGIYYELSPTSRVLNIASLLILNNSIITLTLSLPN